MKRRRAVCLGFCLVQETEKTASNGDEKGIRFEFGDEREQKESKKSGEFLMERTVIRMGDVGKKPIVIKGGTKQQQQAHFVPDIVPTTKRGDVS